MNVTPLVDVVLVLLIIFMIVIPNMQEGRHVNLPHALFGIEESRLAPLRITLSHDGRMDLDGTGVTTERLRDRLATRHREAPTQPIVIRSDSRSRYGLVRDVFAACQGAGFVNIALQTAASAADSH